MQKKLMYSFSQEEVQFLVNAVNRLQVAGVESARSIVYMDEKLRKPDNIDELEKDQLESLKAKYESKKDKK